GRNKYEYFGFWRSVWANSASPSSADIPVSFGPPNVDIFPSTRKRISSGGWIFCLGIFFRLGRLAAGFYFEGLRFGAMARSRYSLSRVEQRPRHFAVFQSIAKPKTSN